MPLGKRPSVSTVNEIAQGMPSLAAARASVALSGLDSSFQMANSSLGIDVSSSFTSYTWGALAFEVFLAVWAGLALLKKS